MQKTRYFEFDLLKVMVLILMPMSHIFDEFGFYYNLMNNIPDNYVTQLGLLFMNIPAIFMICLGFGVVFSKNSTPGKLLRRGLWMFIIEAILNLFRIIIPHSVAGYLTGISEYITESFERSLMSDILPFAGCAFLFFALIKKLNISKICVLTIGIMCTIIQTFIPQPEITNTYLRYLAGYFIYVDSSSFFPIVSWMIYPIIGYVLGVFFVKTENKTKFYLKVGGFGLLMFLLTNFYLIFTDSMQPRYYLFMETGFHMDLFTTLIVMSTSLIYLGVSYFICKIFSRKIQGIIASISVNINSIYCIHWVLVKILWCVAIVFAFKIEYNYLFIIGFLIFVLSAILASLRYKLMHFNH